jgi:DNA-binding NarL/FixJ family response regulator
MDVLLVEENATSRRALRQVIHTKTSFEVVAEASSATEALQVVEQCRPDVVVTAVELPEMDGVDLTKEVKRRYPAVHVLALTSRCDTSTQQLMRDAGASGFIAKSRGYEKLTYALDVADCIGPDRRRGDRSRAVASIWTSL